MSAMNEQTPAQKRRGIALTAVALIIAVWLVWPFVHIERSAYGQGKILAYRLFLGLAIMLVYVGKSMFDALAPQGLARKVSNAKGIALIVLTVLLTGFIIYIVGQATVLFLTTSAREQQQQQNIQYIP